MGDVWGSIVLAEALAALGHEVSFVLSRREEGAALLLRRGQRTIVAPSLGEQVRAMGDLAPHAIVVNKLTSPTEELLALRRLDALLATIEDTGEGSRCADLRINVLYHVPDAITDLRYIALRGDPLRLHGRPRSVPVVAGSLLVMQGGADTHGFLPRIVAALGSAGFDGRITVVVGPAFAHWPALRAAVDGSGLAVSVTQDPPDLTERMAGADLAITAAGITLFELLCVGTPCVVVSAERFEVETAERVAQQGAAVSLGFGGDLDAASLGRVVGELAHDAGARRRLASRGRELVDGRGAERTAKLIEERVEARRGGG